MKISSLLKPEAIAIGAAASSKDDAISKLVDLMTTQGNVADRDAYEAAVHAREDEGTTALGEGIAIPHAKTSAVTAPGLAAMTLPAGVDYDAPDGQPTTLMFLIAALDTKADVHLEVLSRLSTLLMDPEFCASLRDAKDPAEFPPPSMPPRPPSSPPTTRRPPRPPSATPPAMTSWPSRPVPRASPTPTWPPRAWR